MQVNVKYLENLRLEANFDDFSVIADQPIRYKGDGTAPGPYDYFLASSALCAAYFVKVYCNARDIPTDDILISQQNIVDPNNRYKQSFKLEIELPDSISEKDKEGMLRSMDRCTVKRVIQNNPEFIIEAKSVNDKKAGLEYETENSQTHIPGKDCSLEDTIKTMTKILEDLGIQIEIASWRNPIPHVWSVHIRDADSPMCFTNGKGATKDAALCSALGEYLERISNNYFYNDYFLGNKRANDTFVHYPDEKWFPLTDSNEIPEGLMDQTLMDFYNPENELKANHLVDTNSGNYERGICAIPFTRASDEKQVYIPVNIVGNLYVSNGMSAGNTIYEARVQCLSEIFERAVKNEIIRDEITLPDVPKEVIAKYSKIEEGIKSLEAKGYPIYVKDASLGGKFPVISVTLMNPQNGGVFASFGSHPQFEVALERTLTELLQGRSFEGLNDLPRPTLNGFAVQEHNNIVDHFIDSTGVISWKFFSNKEDYEFVEWDFKGSTEEEYNYLMSVLKDLGKEVYIADYEGLGAKACRILVPDYSEIYEVDDLIWDNNNQSLQFRDRILNIHSLDHEQLAELATDLEESEIDNYTAIGEIIGIAFDENSVWGQLDIGELKGMIYTALQRFDEAKEYVEMFLTFNDNLPERKRYYQLLNVLLDIELNEELELDNYEQALINMYSEELLKDSKSVLSGEINFYGLTKTNMELENNLKHIKLIESYEKLQNMRAQSKE